MQADLVWSVVSQLKQISPKLKLLAGSDVVNRNYLPWANVSCTCLFLEDSLFPRRFSRIKQYKSLISYKLLISQRI